MINPYHTGERFTLYAGDAIEVLSELPSHCVHCVVTSPPYWGLRDYGTGTWIGGNPACPHSTGRGSNIPHTKYPTVSYPASPAHRGGNPQTCRRCGAVREDRQYGLETTPEDYVNSLRAVFAHLYRVLADTGTVWLNLGDCYSTPPPRYSTDPLQANTPSDHTTTVRQRESVPTPSADRSHTLPRKNLLGMPWRVALALQQDRWILRNAIVWHKPNAMPESVRDRLSTRYEMLFLLVKQPHYWFDLDSIRESLTHPEAPGAANNTPKPEPAPPPENTQPAPAENTPIPPHSPAAYTAAHYAPDTNTPPRIPEAATLAICGPSTPARCAPRTSPPSRSTSHSAPSQPDAHPAEPS
jgi:DNA modification methylase